MKYPVTLVESSEGWAVWCDTLPGCCSQGASREEALANIRVAIEEYLAARAAEIRGDAAVRSVEHAEVAV
jgi:predicted RNase H-like HicB family nuclease